MRINIGDTGFACMQAKALNIPVLQVLKPDQISHKAVKKYQGSF